MATLLKVTAFSFITLCVLAVAGPVLAALLLCGAITAIGIHYFMKSKSIFGQIIWGSVAAVGALAAISNIPGLAIVAIIAALYYAYKKDALSFTETNDPFDNFEREWAKMNK